MIQRKLLPLLVITLLALIGTTTAENLCTVETGGVTADFPCDMPITPLQIVSIGQAVTIPAVSYQVATSVIYVAQQTEDEDGEEIDESTVAASVGLEFWFNRQIFGFTVGMVGLPDEEQDTPRVAPFASFNLGGPTLKWSVGGAYDAQNGGDNNLVLLTGGTFSF